MWRSIVGLLILGCATAPASSGDSPFDKAKKGNEAAKLDFLEGFLGKLVYDKEKNPAGSMKAWYYVPAASHKGTGCHCGACAREALREEYRKEGREKSFEKELPSILQGLESPAGRLTPFYREGAPIGQKKYQGILLVGDLFSLTNEEELRSALEDFLPTYIKDREEGMVFKDGDNEYVLNVYAPATKEIAHTSLIILHARSVQIEKIARKARNVSEGYRQAVVKNYLDSHRLYCEQCAKQKKIYDDNNENELQKEIAFFLMYMKSLIHENMKKVGLEHREIDRKTFEYSLVGF